MDRALETSTIAVAMVAFLASDDASFMTGAELVVESRGDSVRARLDGREVLTCTGIEPMARGRIGLGPVGPAGSELTLFALSATR